VRPGLRLQAGLSLVLWAASSATFWGRFGGAAVRFVCLASVPSSCACWCWAEIVSHKHSAYTTPTVGGMLCYASSLSQKL
jgi:hypothetical protein